MGSAAVIFEVVDRVSGRRRGDGRGNGGKRVVVMKACLVMYLVSTETFDRCQL